MLKLQRKWYLLLTAIVVGMWSAAASGQGTTFTYQGQLKFSGSLVDGLYDFRFILYNADIGGSQIGSIDVGDVSVMSGLLSAENARGAGGAAPRARLFARCEASPPAALEHHPVERAADALQRELTGPVVPVQA